MKFCSNTVLLNCACLNMPWVDHLCYELQQLRLKQGGGGGVAKMKWLVGQW